MKANTVSPRRAVRIAGAALACGLLLLSGPALSNSSKEKVIQIISELLASDASEVKEQSHLVDDLGADELDVAEIVIAIEEEYNLDIEQEDAEEFAKVNDIIRYVDSHAEE